MSDTINVIEEARRVFDVEINALQKTKESLNEDFQSILSVILQCKGKIIITGMGKSGHVGAKIAATLASLGTAAFFMHPAEALHGDLGMAEERDVLLLLSHSGESEEIIRILPTLHEIGCTTVAITGNGNSTLARLCDYRFVFPEFEEACYMHLAPTASTTALLALGDAFAVAASKVINYTREDFGLRHPAGALGKTLLVKVSDLMYSGAQNAVVGTDSTLQNAIIEMSTKGLSMVNVVDEDAKLKGIITDGDLRRILQRRIDVYHVLIQDVMTQDPKWIDFREMAVNALQKMNELHITCMPVLNEEHRVVGSILMQDIIKAGIVR